MNVTIANIKKDIDEISGIELEYDHILKYLNSQFDIEINKMSNYWNKTVSGDIANDVVSHFTGKQNFVKYRETIYLSMPSRHAYGAAFRLKESGEQKSFAIRTNSLGRIDVAANSDKPMSDLGVPKKDRQKYYPQIAEYLIKHYGGRKIDREEFFSLREEGFKKPGHLRNARSNPVLRV